MRSCLRSRSGSWERAHVNHDGFIIAVATGPVLSAGAPAFSPSDPLILQRRFWGAASLRRSAEFLSHSGCPSRLFFKVNCKVFKSAARIARRPAVALEFGPGIHLRRGSASGDFAGRSRATSRSAIPAFHNMSSPYKPWRAGGTKFAFCPQQLQRLKDYALASRQEYK